MVFRFIVTAVESDLTETANNSHLDVESLDFISTGEDTSTSDTTEDVGTSTLHHRHETFSVEDLHTAIKGGLVVDTLNIC